MVTARRHEGGFTYLTALFMIAIMSAGLALAGEMWETASLRGREAELLYVGHQYRVAIQRYQMSGGGLYPRTLQDLIKDPRSVSARRHLRKLYADPITGSSEWGIVKAPDGGIMGIYSRSEQAPLKVTHFRLRDRDFEGAKKYSDWKFVYAPTAAGQQRPGLPITPPGSSGSPVPAPGVPLPPPPPMGTSQTPLPPGATTPPVATSPMTPQK
jgi:type II secretory pathway pseudopilin PulG